MKIKSYRTFWILLGIALLSIPAFSYMLYNLMNNSFPKGKNGQSILGSPFAFPDGWQTVSWISSLLFILPALLIITLTTNEFTFKTHRQNIIDGWGRGQFIRVKLVEVVLLSLLCTLVVFLTILGFGYIGNKAPQDISVWKDSRFLGFYFVQAFAYLMIAFVLSILIKRAGLAIGVFLIYMIVEQVIVGIFRNLYKINAVDYLPEEVTDRLIPIPFIRVDMTSWEHKIPVYLAVAGLYFIIYCLVTGRYFLKSDL